MPPKAVIDTNESIRAAARDTNPVRQAWMNNNFEWVTSEALIGEFIEVISRPKVQQYLSPENAALLVELLRARATFVTPAAETPSCRDPDDLPLIGTAIAGKTDYLVTADNDLLDDPELQSALSKLGIQVTMAGPFITALRNLMQNADAD